GLPNIGDVPQAYGLIFARRSQAAAIGTEGDAQDPLLVAAQDQQGPFPVRACVPDLDGILGTRNGQQASTRVKRQLNASSTPGDVFAYGENDLGSLAEPVQVMPFPAAQALRALLQQLFTSAPIGVKKLVFGGRNSIGVRGLFDVFERLLLARQ